MEGVCPLLSFSAPSYLRVGGSSGGSCGGKQQRPSVSQGTQDTHGDARKNEFRVPVGTQANK